MASVGFTAYSALAKNWVFTVTNGLMLVSAILGWGITAHFRRQSPGLLALGGSAGEGGGGPH